MVTSGITQEEIIDWGGAEVFNQALAIVNSGDVADVEYDDEHLEIRGHILQSDGYRMPVTFHLEPHGRIRSGCPCATNVRYGQICPHVVALGYALFIRELPAEDAPAAAADDAALADEPRFIEVPARSVFYATIRGSRASLSIELDVYYGDGAIDFPACSAQPPKVVYLEDPADELVRRVRDLDREREAVKVLEGYGFEPGYRTGDMRYYLTSPQGVLNFLGEGLPALRRLGWHTELSPALGRFLDATPTVGAAVIVRDAPAGAIDVTYSFTAAREGATAAVSPVEVQAAINRGDAYIMHDGAVTLLDRRGIEEMHRVFRDVASAGSGRADGSFRVAAVHGAYVKSVLDRLDSFDLDDSRAPDWRQRADICNRQGGTKIEPVALGRLEGVLRPYQKEGVYYLRYLEESALAGLLADEMGLGKTLQTLTWLSLPRADGVQGPALIVCPTSLVRNWEAEAAKFTPWLKTLVLSGGERAERFAEIDATDLVITSYALLQRDLEAAYLGREFATVVLDEAQRIKNRQTKNAVAAKAIRARHRLVLTGTPVENSVADVWSIFDFLLPGYLADYERFKLRYEQPIADGGLEAEAAMADLKLKLHPFILRRLKTTVAKELPPKLVQELYTPIDEEAQEEYRALMAKERRGAKTRFQMLALLMKLRLVASRGKLDAFMETLDEALAGGHRVLVFSQFVRQLHAIAERLEAVGIDFCYLDGATADRMGEVSRFHRDRSVKVFLISLMAGGTGLNLTGADMVIHYDPWWNPAVEDQATDRAHRIGQTRQVHVLKLIAAGTVEEKVLELQRRKQAVIAATVGTTDAMIAKRLTEAELAQLLDG